MIETASNPTDDADLELRDIVGGDYDIPLLSHDVILIDGSEDCLEIIVSDNPNGLTLGEMLANWKTLRTDWWGDGKHFPMLRNVEAMISGHGAKRLRTKSDLEAIGVLINRKVLSLENNWQFLKIETLKNSPSIYFFKDKNGLTLEAVEQILEKQFVKSCLTSVE